MAADEKKPTIAADEDGVHFLSSRHDHMIRWGEIDQICAVKEIPPDESPYIRIYIDHYCGVDFQICDTEPGYDQVVAEMQKHLLGFSLAKLEAVGTYEASGDELPVIWKRDEKLQPFQLRPPAPPGVDPGEPNAEERSRMESTRQATIATCEKLMARPLQSDEIACVEVTCKNGVISGNILAPLSKRMVQRQREIFGV